MPGKRVKRSVVRVRCGICGAPVGGASSDLVGGIWDLAICAQCGRRRLLDDGGVAFELRALPANSRFDLGEIHVRPGALHILAESGDHYWPFVERHARGDGGSFPPCPSAAAGAAADKQPFLASSGNIVSEYRTETGHRLWVMTTPGKVTAVMAPGEF